jgi:HEAT repeat protein
MAYGKLKHHMGTFMGYTGNPSITWDNTWIPDQDSIKIMARITDITGITYTTPAVSGLTLRRPTRSVKMYTAFDVPEKFNISRARTRTCHISVKDNISRAQAANLVLSTWSGVEATQIGLNNNMIAENTGKFNEPSFDRLAVPLKYVQKGINTFYVHSVAGYHAVEINWPGPALFVEFGKTDTTLNAGHVLRFIDSLKSKNWIVRKEAAGKLGKIKDIRAIKPLVALLENEPMYTKKSWIVRRNAALALGGIKDPDGLPLFIESLKSEKWFARVYVVNALGNYQDPGIVDPLIRCLKDEAKEVRSRAAVILGDQKIKKAVKPLMALFQYKSDDEYEVRIAALQALGKIKDRRANRAIAKCLHDEIWMVRLAAVRALIQGKHPKVKKLLKRAAKDNNPAVKQAASEGLAMVE